ncbi:MAG TPA: 7,8-didemethyl-8-hydroxy-5-deazariboflavin synthase CofG [Candidatus Binataceae bacterium]|nr:7,8-didemethyl-8-hydroxy-5-deazariboflavin synthase CofG [Candidatus Binataceae bacterium]
MAEAGTTLQSASLPEILERALAGEALDECDAIRLIECSDAELPLLLRAAAEMRDRGKGREVTYSRKVFLPVTNLCRDRCTYCTFRKDPGEPGAWTMTLREIEQWSRRGREMGCKEALMCLGDKPELAFRDYRELLAARGAHSTIEYVAFACSTALEQGLLPHTNAGIMTGKEMGRLRTLNASMGLMLENISPRLRRHGGVHQWAPDKDPAVRMRMLDEAGSLKVPFTTGILLGIGETPAERAQSLFAIRQSHQHYSHIQEVIIQNFRAKPEIPMADAPEPEAREMARAIATARLVLGPEMNVQAPPNLSPHEIELFLDAGINDWGGISPLSKDYVNPEAPWPHLEALARRCARAGFHLKQRLAIYPEFINPKWVDPAVMPAIARLTDELLLED